MGTIDFRPYWSSSFLLAHGQDFGDPSILDTAERTLTGWAQPYTMHAWLAPTGNLVLLPYTLFAFPRAAYYWLLSNILIMFLVALLIWHDTKLPGWIPLAATFSFSVTLLSFYFGQVNTLELLGLALFLFLSKLRHDFAAGAGLALTTVKPHLVVLTLPLLLLDILRRRQWRVLAGFVGTLAGSALVLFVLYPSWPTSFWHVVNSGMHTLRETPTVPGLFVLVGEHGWGEWVLAVGLVVALVVWWKYGKEFRRRMLIDVSILAGMVVSPIGWSYDQVMLLFPILHVLEWAANGSLTRKDAVAVVLSLMIINAVTFYQRTLGLSEVWFFWVPMVVAVVYVSSSHRRESGLVNIAARVA